MSGGGYSMGSGSQRNSEAESLTLAGEKGGRGSLLVAAELGSQRQAWRAPEHLSWASVLSGGRGGTCRGCSCPSSPWLLRAGRSSWEQEGRKFGFPPDQGDGEGRGKEAGAK